MIKNSFPTLVLVCACSFFPAVAFGQDSANPPLNPDKVRASMAMQLAQLVSNGAAPPTNGGTAAPTNAGTVPPVPEPRSIPVMDASESEAFKTASELMGQKKYSEADKILTAMIATHPKNMQAYRVRAEVRIRGNNFEGALEDANTSLNHFRDDIPILIFLAKALTGLGRSQEALPVMQEAIDLNPKNPRAFYIRSKIWHGLNRPNEELADLRQARAIFTEDINRHPDMATPHIDRSFYWRALGQPEEATNDLKQALAILDKKINKYPKDALLYGTRAEAWQELGELKKRLADLAKAAELNPRNKDLYEDALKENSQQSNPPAK